jgi:hypothetical protein
LASSAAKKDPRYDVKARYSIALADVRLPDKGLVKTGEVMVRFRIADRGSVCHDVPMARWEQACCIKSRRAVLHSFKHDGFDRTVGERELMISKKN